MANVLNGDTPTLKLYTNHLCPFAQRAHIALKELGLKYEEVIIDLSKPREPWYLEINPRGLVPTLDFNGTVITESGIIATFLADAYHSHLYPASGTPESALARARINFFIDSWTSKVGSYLFKLTYEEGPQKEKLGQEFVDAVAKEIEPLLVDAAPYFSGSTQLTLAEVMVAPFLLRIYASAKHGIVPASVVEAFSKLPNFTKWVEKVTSHESVLDIWDEEAVIAATKKRLETIKANKAKSG